MLKLMGKKMYTIYAENFCLSKPVIILYKNSANVNLQNFANLKITCLSEDVKSSKKHVNIRPFPEICRYKFMSFSS